MQASLGQAEAAQGAATSLQTEAGPAALTDQDLASTVAFAQGQAALAKGDGAGAVALMSKCVPENDLCRYALASAQEKAGDKQAAQATRQAILALNHGDPFALWLRSRITPPAKKKGAP